MTSQDTPKTIRLSGHDAQHEAIALGVIRPGMLLSRAAGGVQAHAVVGGAAEPLFAVENDMTGDGIDDNYAIGEQVYFGAFQPGSHIYALLEDEANVAIGAALASNGAGALQPATAGQNIVAYAAEAVNNTGGTGDVRIRVEAAPGYVSV